MNKGNGGAQPFQRNTIIPDSNPDPSCRGKIQEMTNDLGNGKRQQKGLATVLQERGFDLLKIPRIVAWRGFYHSKMIF
jgi:hypothetical protein